MLPSVSSPSRILLVEDDADAALLMRSMVEEIVKPRFKVAAVAANLADGMARAANEDFDVILLDLMLPDSLGASTFKRMHAASPHVPIIILTGIDDEDLALELLHLGAQEYLVKTMVDGQMLRRAVRYAIERSRAEAQLQAERDLLQTLLENIPDRIYFKDRESRFVRINQALTRLFHLSKPEEAYGKTDADFYGEEHAHEAREDEQRVMETGEAVVNKIEKEVMTDGKHSWSLTTKLPLRDRAGRVIGTCGISREITQIKEMEVALESERNVIRSVIDNLPDLIFLKDAQGRYLLDNLPHLRWLGLKDPLELIGRSVFDFYPKEVAQSMHEDDLAVLESGVALINREERLLDRTGGMHWVLTTKVPWRGEGSRVLGLVCISRDVTGQKQAEENLRQAYADLQRSREEVVIAMRKLQAAHSELREVQLQLIEAEKMKLIGRLAAGVAHEVKNPLGVLKMGLDFLATAPIADENAPLILKEMSDAVQRADYVIRGLLDFSAPRKLELSPADMNQIIESALTMVRGEMKDVYRVERELQENLPAVPVDAAKISQVFVNLFTNAVHAMDSQGLGQGTLRIRTYARQLTGVGANIGGKKSESFRVGQRLVVVEIEDTGCGIPDDKLPKVFEPFFTTKPTGAGTGLGLSVVKTIIDLHGGTIDLSNRPDGGLRVSIMLHAPETVAT